MNSSERLNKRKITSTLPKSKRSRSGGSSVSTSNELVFEVQEKQGTNLFAAREDSYDNCILRCLVIFPAGRPIIHTNRHWSWQALRDAIKAHQSLDLDGRILHRDISENNIIITDAQKPALRECFLTWILRRIWTKGPVALGVVQAPWSSWLSRCY
ncbi:hypothetical protein VTN31DRAFT_3190 [Thermomyces dupontii]|uniref:uncharacterized protein n=1 Tax=Talaromyces thermophilus TaxID=28565 RepID=UPI003742CAA8